MNHWIFSQKDEKYIKKLERNTKFLNNEDRQNCISILYKIGKKYQVIKLFDMDFVMNNYNKCKLIIEGEENKLKNYIIINNKSNADYLLISLKVITNITNLSSMFFQCELLLYFFGQGLNFGNIKEMSFMFRNCSLLKRLPDIML